ncbi:MAG: dTMP kinase [Nitrospirota bacterium]|nr:dTMP kinase [Nitrospirota bacterium]MDH5775480.1 dTMP kinase [Nitrospirota bacterium]
MKHTKTHIKKSRALRGAFITFEGTEGSGKSTQCRRLAQTLQGQGYHVLETREPGGTPLAEAIRGLFLATSKANIHKEAITPACESMLIFAARAQHVAHVIQPALEKGMVVLCDRFFDSTLAYQGYARGLEKTFLYEAQQFATNGLQPHFTFFLDLPIQDGLARRRQSNKQDRLDQESLRFHQRVRRGFLALAKHDPMRIHTVDARQSPQTLASHIASVAEQLLQDSRSLHLLRSSKKKSVE